MYKLLIVDDEEYVRHSIANKIDWNGLGFSAVYQAEHGVEALELALKYKPDLVLADIKMPFMDGLELAAKLKVSLPSANVVILTGHDEFKYAQEAIDLGVINYILKPVGVSTLTKKIAEIRVKLDNALQQKQYLEKTRCLLNESLPLLKERLLNTIVCTPNHDINIKSRFDFLDIPMMAGPYFIALTEPDLSGINTQDVELFIFAMKNIASDTFGPHNLIFCDGFDRIVFIFNIPDYIEEKEYRSIIADTIHIFHKNVSLYLKISLTSSLGSTVKEITDLYSSYSESISALDCKFTLGKDKIFDIYDLNYLETGFYYPFDACSKFINAVKLSDNNGIRESLGKIGGFLKGSKNTSAVNIKLVFTELVTNLLKLLAEIRGTPQETWTNGFSQYNTIGSNNTVDEIVYAILPYALNVSNVLANTRENSSRSLILKVMDYIGNSYFMEDISLHTAAVHVSVSSNYLSVLFKKETGSNFIDYLTKVRMEKAMDLLRTTDMKTYEVAFKTGFSNPHYFSIAFKKYTGLTTSEFRNLPGS